MHPILFTLEFFGRSLPYHAYGGMISLGILLGLTLALLNGRREGIHPNHVIGLSLWVVVIAIATARVAFVLTAEIPTQGPGGTPVLKQLFAAGGGGFVFLGGLLGGLATAAIYTRRSGIPFLKMTDTLVPGLVVGQALGRLGCLLAGCCWGRPSDTPLPAWLLRVVEWDWPRSLTLTFTHPQTLCGSPGIPLVPIQVLQSLSCLAIFVALWFVVRPRKTWDGQLFAWYLVLYAVVRSTLELFRDDPRGGLLDGLISTSQAISLPLLVIGLWLMRAKRPPAQLAE